MYYSGSRSYGNVAGMPEVVGVSIGVRSGPLIGIQKGLWRNFGACALSVCSDQSGLEQVDLCPTVHLALHELEPCDLTLGLSIVSGYERYTYECSGCREVEHRPVFNTGRKGPIRRNVRIVPHPKYESSYAAQDTKSGLVVMLHQDRNRLRELCEWIGWRVVDGDASSWTVPDAVSVEASDARFVERSAELI